MNARSILAFALTVPCASVAGAVPSAFGNGPSQGTTPAIHADDKPAADPAAADKRLRTAFAALSAAQKKDLLDFFELETSHLPSFQASLIAWTLKQQDRDPLDWPERPKLEYFDPALHAPAQPIARTWLDANSAQATKASLKFLEKRSPRAVRRTFIYDYASREIVRVPVADEATRVFENALLGHPRRLDLAEALVERMLDDGAQHKAARAFAHAYTDRSGHAYPGITLFDAHKSGAEIEMPDVDTLGIVHTLFDDHTTWTAPVPEKQQDALYEKIGDAFLPLNLHVSLRRALAATFFQGKAPLTDGYAATIDNLHALWEDCDSTPEKLVARLPAAKDVPEFLAAWVKRCYEPEGPFKAGQHRREVLDQNASEVRATLERVMTEFGAFAPRATTEDPKKQAEAPREPASEEPSRMPSGVR